MTGKDLQHAYENPSELNEIPMREVYATATNPLVASVYQKIPSEVKAIWWEAFFIQIQRDLESQKPYLFRPDTVHFYSGKFLFFKFTHATPS